MQSEIIEIQETDSLLSGPRKSYFSSFKKYAEEGVINSPSYALRGLQYAACIGLAATVAAVGMYLLAGDIAGAKQFFGIVSAAIACISLTQSVLTSLEEGGKLGKKALVFGGSVAKAIVANLGIAAAKALVPPVVRGKNLLIDGGIFTADLAIISLIEEGAKHFSSKEKKELHGLLANLAATAVVIPASGALKGLAVGAVERAATAFNIMGACFVAALIMFTLNMKGTDALKKCAGLQAATPYRNTIEKLSSSSSDPDSSINP